MKVLIVEDEQLLSTRLKQLLLQIEKTAEVVASTQSVAETVEWLEKNPMPDLILLDIELADGQSFEIFQRTNVTAPVIFITAYDEYAIKAFKVNSVDYLLKPVKEEELKAALQKFESLSAANKASHNIDALIAAINNMPQPGNYKNRFLVKSGQKMFSVDLTDIAYFFSENGLSFIRTNQNQKYIIEYSLDELEKMLDPSKFFRANRQFILGFDCVVAIHPWFNQKLKVEVKPSMEEHVVISRDKANQFKAWMGE